MYIMLRRDSHWLTTLGDGTEWWSHHVYFKTVNTLIQKFPLART